MSLSQLRFITSGAKQGSGANFEGRRRKLLRLVSKAKQPPPAMACHCGGCCLLYIKALPSHGNGFGRLTRFSSASAAGENVKPFAVTGLLVDFFSARAASDS